MSDRCRVIGAVNAVMRLGQSHPERTERAARIRLLVNDGVFTDRRDGEHLADADREAPGDNIIVEQVEHTLREVYNDTVIGHRDQHSFCNQDMYAGIEKFIENMPRTLNENICALLVLLAYS